MQPPTLDDRATLPTLWRPTIEQRSARSSGRIRRCSRSCVELVPELAQKWSQPPQRIHAGEAVSAASAAAIRSECVEFCRLRRSVHLPTRPSSALVYSKIGTKTARASWYERVRLGWCANTWRSPTSASFSLVGPWRSSAKPSQLCSHSWSRSGDVCM